jgi:hypothetical protein
MMFHSFKTGQTKEAVFKKYGDTGYRCIFDSEVIGYIFDQYDGWSTVSDHDLQHPVRGFKTRNGAFTHLMKVAGHTPWTSQQEIDWLTQGHPAKTVES